MHGVLSLFTVCTVCTVTFSNKMELHLYIGNLEIECI